LPGPGFKDCGLCNSCWVLSYSVLYQFVYYKSGTDVAYLLLYVDDIVLSASSTALLQRVIASLHHQEFSMTDLGLLNYFLRIFVVHTVASMFLSQDEYAYEVLKCDLMLNCNLYHTLIDIDSKLGTDEDHLEDPTVYCSLAGFLTTHRSTSWYCVFLGNNLLFGSSKRHVTFSRSSAEAEYHGVVSA
nr:retrotransposon protein, putative, unclassified [Tanacetum cinerariifolium]GFA64087.1 retrotransposon protein, putative, unclassified [Tanacetum cinerariifolium]